jgi:hypothetical protein
MPDMDRGERNEHNQMKKGDSATGVILYSLGIALFVKKVTYRKERVSITNSNKLFPNLIQWIS